MGRQRRPLAPVKLTRLSTPGAVKLTPFSTPGKTVRKALCEEDTGCIQTKVAERLTAVQIPASDNGELRCGLSASLRGGGWRLAGSTAGGEPAGVFDDAAGPRPTRPTACGQNPTEAAVTASPAPPHRPLLTGRRDASAPDGAEGGEGEEGAAFGTGAGEVDLEGGGPVVVAVGVHQDLLDLPGAAVV